MLSRSYARTIRARAYHSRISASRLPYRERSLANKHGECLNHIPSVEGMCAVHGAAHNAGLIRSVSNRRSALQRKHHARPVWPKFVRQGFDPTPKAVPASAGFRTLQINVATGPGAMATQDSCRFVECFDLQDLATGCALPARPTGGEGSHSPGRPCLLGARHDLKQSATPQPHQAAASGQALDRSHLPCRARTLRSVDEERRR